MLVRYLEVSVSVATHTLRWIWLCKLFEMKHDCTHHTKQDHCQLLGVHCIRSTGNVLSLLKLLLLQFASIKRKIFIIVTSFF